MDFGFEVDSICWIYWMGSVSTIVVAKYHCRSRILQLLGLGFCKENRSRKLKMALGGNYILGLVYCKGLKGGVGHIFCKELM